MVWETTLSRKYAAYPEYKESGVEWLGEVPINWDIKKLKYICKVQTGTKNTENAIEEGVYPFFVRSQTVERINSFGADCEAVLTAGDGVGVGRVFHYIEGKFDYHQRVYMLNNFGAVLGRFVYYYLSNNFYKVALEGNAKSTVDSLRLPQFLNFEFSLPKIEVQNRIIDFLDHETAKIDTLIDKQQQLITLLKEKRQAVISHAVTKGLKPNAPMRDSGVEWLGEVPAHWDVRAVSKLSQKITNGYVGPTRDILVPDGVPYVQATHIKKGKVNFDDAYFVRLPWSDAHAKSILVKGDVLIVQTGAGTGDIGLVTENEEGFNCHALIIVQPIKNVISGDYLSMAFQSQYGYSVLYSIRTGGMHPHLNCGEVQFVKIPVPPIEEQGQIIEHIIQQLHKFDTLVDRQLLAIELMKERRTALISAAVTGKIDVRNWQEPALTNNNKEVAP